MASMAENRKLQQEILRLEDDIARLEMKNNQLEEELKRANPNAVRASSAAPPVSKPAPRMEHKDAQTTEPWPGRGPTGAFGQGRSGVDGGDDSGGYDPITGKPLPPGAKKLGGGSDDDLRKEIK